MHKHWSRITLEICFVIYCILWTVPEVDLKCAGTDMVPFDILPEEDLIIEYGSTLELFCKLNKSLPDANGLDSRDLKFYQLTAEGQYILPNVTIVNDTTIKAVLVEPPLGSTQYYCSLNDTKVCPTNVQVGYKPQPVLNFQCTSYNWEKLHCYWTPPENPIKTIYTLNYTLKGRAGRIPRSCPYKLDVKNNSCLYDHETNPPFRQPHEYYYFELFGKNVLGNLSTTYTFHHFAHVIPNKPENVTIVNKTVGSVVVGWHIPYPIFNFSPGLRLKIEYKNQWEDWKEVDIPRNLSIHGKNYTYNITGLKYAHTVYDVRIYLKSFVAKIGPNDWSLPASTTFITPAKIPDSPPLTTQGSFDVVSSGNDTDVFIYWARVSEKFKNGVNFTYNVICTANGGYNCGPPLEKSDSYAKFSFNSRHSYTYTIYSVNEVGRSVNNSYVFVSKSVIQPESFTKVVYDNGVFELSWKPISHWSLSNYTIFWCKEEKDLPVPCKGYLDWVTVPKGTTTKNITVNDVTKFYKFAIASNLIDGTSSGMVWSSCVIFHDKVLKKVDDFHISNIRSREVDVVWEIRCAQSSAFKGFALYYCPVDFSMQDNNCKENTTEAVKKLNGSHERNVTLTNLKPYTTYKLQISIISLDGSQQIQLGPRSASRQFSTLADAPSEPVNLSADLVTNNSIAFTWGLPKEMNGRLKMYKLYLERPGQERKEVEINAKNLSDNSIISRYILYNLASYVTYNVSLKACTSEYKCSEYSKPVSVTTLIGPPGKMSRPQVSIENASLADVSWEPPAPSAGPLNYYQLLITVDGESTENEIFNVTGSRAKLAIGACQVEHNKPEFRMRAININRNNVSFYGPWSEPTEIHCGSAVRAENSVLIDWISGTCTLIIVSVCLVYIIKKGWLQCRKMKDVEVKLPSGLQDIEKDSQDCIHLEGWPPRSPETVMGSVGTVVAPDEESLLEKKSDEMDITSFNMPVKSGGDSSCSAGRESVSSSITSDTPISSDSGYTDQYMIKSNGFEGWNSSGRRHGNNGNTRNDFEKEVLRFPNLPDWDSSEPAIPRYTKVGFTNGFVSEKNLPDNGYVTFTDVPSVNPSQKTCNETLDNALTEKNTSNFSDKPFSSISETRSDNVRSQPSEYVSFDHFEGQKMGESTNLLGDGRSVGRELPKLSRLDESLDRDDEKTEDSTEEDFSGKETDTETIHEVPVTRNLTALPPYVSVTDRTFQVSNNVESDEGEEEEEEEEEEQEKKNCSVEDKEEGRLPNITIDLGNRSLANDIGSAFVERVNKENESFSNYIPHHLFGKESVHT